jgi:hypothetical protein
MAELPDGTVALARLRAARVQARPQDLSTMRGLTAAAARAGRTLVEVATDSGPCLLLGWLDGSEPVDQDDGGIKRRHPAPTVLLTFAACLRAVLAGSQRGALPRASGDRAAGPRGAGHAHHAQRCKAGW